MEGTLLWTWLYLSDSTWSQSTNRPCITIALLNFCARRALPRPKLPTLVAVKMAVQSKLLTSMNQNQPILIKTLLMCLTTQMLISQNKLRTSFSVNLESDSKLYSQTFAIFHLSIGINGSLPLVFQLFFVINNTVFWRFQFVQQ